MSEGWQFASREGMLRWTTPALPEGGAMLFSVLSPTLLLGYQQEGDVLPVDFIKLSSVFQVRKVAPTNVEIQRDGGPQVLLVAQSEDDANTWMDTINVAIRGGGASAEVAPGAHVAQAATAASPQPRPVAERSMEDTARPTAQKGNWIRDGYQKYATGQEPAKESAVMASVDDRQSPRRDRESQEAPVPMAEHVSAPAEPAVGSAVPVDQSHAAQWASPQVHQRPTGGPNVPPQNVQQAGTLAHDFVPVSQLTGTGQPGRATTTTVAQHDEIRNPQPGASQPAPSQSAVRPEPADMSGSRPMPADFSATSVAGAMPHAAAPQAASSWTPTNPAVSRRSMMMVDVPANHTFNTNLEPNESAIWKEWKDPEGNLIVFHEPSQTLQRLQVGATEFETLVVGAMPISEQDLLTRPSYTGSETTFDVGSRMMKNVQNYGRDHTTTQPLPDPGAVGVGRGNYSPTRRAAVDVVSTQPRAPSGYHGRRVHKLVLDGNGVQSQVEHQVQSLDSSGLMWDPKNGTAFSSGGASRGDIGMNTLEKQWNHVRKVLLQGRYFKKHAINSSTSSFRYLFLTPDNSYAVCVPTSEVLLNVNQGAGPQEFASVAETVQYFGADSRAIALNTITHVSMGTEEQFVMRRRKDLVPENVFCIVSRTHAFVMECNSPEEARYFCDAWTFFLYHSRPLVSKKTRTPEMVAPVTHGTRSGIRW